LQRILQVNLLKNKGLLFEAHAILKQLLLKPVLLKEQNIVNLTLAWLYYDAGNYRDAKIIIKSLTNSKLTNIDEKVHHFILESRLSEVNSDFKTAKAKLEQILDDAALNDKNKAIIFHDLARLEDAQGNLNTALDYYNEAWRLIKTTCNFPQINVTASNLSLLNARTGDNIKARKVLSEYENLIDKNNPYQILELNNRTIELARQISDRSLLLQSYKTSDELILPRLTQDERFALLIHELRMRFCDRVNFEPHLVKIMWHLVNAKNLELLHQLIAYKEVLGILRQAISHTGSRPDLIVYNGWITLQYIQQEASLDAQRTEIPPSLPSYREQLLKFKLELIKIKINLSLFAISKQLFESLFSLLAELKNIWSDKDNTEGEMKGLILILDEYIAYSEQLNDKRFKKDFADLAQKTLDQAEELLKNTWQQHAMHEYTAGLAWFWFIIMNNREKAEFWLKIFESKKISLEHYQPWYRKQYQKTKEWLNQKYN
jgi:exonuclease VII small subunit